MADNGENILVEFDYDNITLIDPNKLVDEQGNVKDRLVKQEDLVYYANLECQSQRPEVKPNDHQHLENSLGTHKQDSP